MFDYNRQHPLQSTIKDSLKDVTLYTLYSVTIKNCLNILEGYDKHLTEIQNLLKTELGFISYYKDKYIESYIGLIGYLSGFKIPLDLRDEDVLDDIKPLKDILESSEDYTKMLTSLENVGVLLEGLLKTFENLEYPLKYQTNSNIKMILKRVEADKKFLQIQKYSLHN